MRILFLSTLLLISFKSYASDANAVSAAIKPAYDLPKVLKFSAGVTVIDDLDRMRKSPYNYGLVGTQPSQAVSWADEGHIFAGVHTDVVVYDKNTKEQKTFFNTANYIRAVAAAQKTIVVGYAATVNILDDRTSLISKYHHVGNVCSVSISDDGNIVAAGGYAYDGLNSHTLALYDVRKKNPISISQFSDFITSVAVSPDSKKVAVGNGNQVNYGDIGTVLQVRKQSADTKKAHQEVTAVTFTQQGGLYSADKFGLLICPMDEETGVDQASPYNRHPWISGLAHAAGGLWVLASDPGTSMLNRNSQVTRRKNGVNTFFDLTGKRLGVCAANKAGDLVLAGSEMVMIKNNE